MTGDDTVEIERLGLATKLVVDDDLDATATGFTTQLAQGPTRRWGR